jgi:hypothetical protein
MAQDMTPLGKADSMLGLEEWSSFGRTATLHSLGAFDEVKKEKSIWDGYGQ